MKYLNSYSTLHTPYYTQEKKKGYKRNYKILFFFIIILFFLLSLYPQKRSGSSSVGRASASQAEGREFESRFPLKDFFLNKQIWYDFCM